MESNEQNIIKQEGNDENKNFLEVPSYPDAQQKNATEPVLKPPPDGGYGWVILAASFTISFILDAIMYSFGILLGAIKDYFVISNKSANLLTSLYTGFFLLCGPLVAGLVKQFGCQVAIIGGAFVTSLMYFVSIFSPNIYMMYMTIGVVGGISTGIMYISSLIIIAEYFQEKRGIATGITMAGSGIGFFVGPPLFKWLIKNYDWKVTTIACAGCLFLNCLIGILSKPLNPPKSSFSFSRKKKQEVFVEEINVEIMSGSIVSLSKKKTS